MKTYKIEANEKEIDILIAALKMYKGDIFDTMINALRSENSEKYNYASKRSMETKMLIRKLQEINDPV